jgi:hypothetical protein
MTFLKKETAEIETGMAGNSSWDQANRRQKFGLVWIIRKKISQIIKDYFHLPFFLLIILWLRHILTFKWPPLQANELRQTLMGYASPCILKAESTKQQRIFD